MDEEVKSEGKCLSLIILLFALSPLQIKDPPTLEQSHNLIKKKTVQALKKRNSIKPVKANYPATIRWEYIPNGHPRVYDPKFIQVADPRSEEKSSENSIEKILLGDR